MREKAWTVVPEFQNVESLKEVAGTHLEALVYLACVNRSMVGRMVTRKHLLQYLNVSPRALERTFKVMADRGIIVGYELAPGWDK